MTGLVLGLIVEGHGEVKAAPVLVRRIAAEVFGVHDVRIPTPFRLPRSQMTDPHQMARAITLMRAKAPEGGQLVLADGDDDCPVDLAGRIQEAAGALRVEVSVPVREFESFFLAGAHSLGTAHPKVRADAQAPLEPEAIGDAKGKLSGLMTERYQVVLHQAAFAAVLDLGEAEACRSFRHLVGCVGRLIGIR